MDLEQQHKLVLSQARAGSCVINLEHDLASASRLDLQMRIRIGIYLAGRGLCVYPLKDLMESGRSSGMNGAEMSANLAGTSHDAKATVCLAFVTALVESDSVLEADCYWAMHKAGYSREQVLDVITQTNMQVLLARLCMAITTLDATVNFGERDCQIFPAD